MKRMNGWNGVSTDKTVIMLVLVVWGEKNGQTWKPDYLRFYTHIGEEIERPTAFLKNCFEMQRRRDLHMPQH